MQAPNGAMLAACDLSFTRALQCPPGGAQPEAEWEDLFPAVELVHAGLSAEEFRRHYFAHLESVGIREIKRGIAEAESLAEAKRKEAVLCCFESVKQPRQSCHRTMFAEWYRQHTGIEIAELGQTKSQMARGKAEPGQPALL